MKPRKAAVVFIFITVTLDMLALGLIVPVLPKLVLDFLGGDAPNAAKMFGIFGTVFALMQFIFSPVLGVLSDRFGRRPVILLSNLGLGLDYIVMALAPTLSWLFHRARHFRNYRREHHHRDSLCRGCGRTGKTGGSVRLDRRRVRGRVRPGSSARRASRQFRSAAAVLGRGRIEPGQCALRIFCPAGIAPAGESAELSLCAGRTPSARSFFCVRIRNCSGSRPSSSSATSRTKFSTSGRSTRFFVMPGGKERSGCRSRWWAFVPS